MNSRLRQRLCDPTIVNSDGSINHAYFLESPGTYWSESDQELLLNGIAEFGVGEVEAIHTKYLPRKSIIHIKLRICLVLGIYNYGEFNGVKNIQDLPQIKANNIEKAKKAGKLRNGIYLNI